jgi:polyhydroxybutyrate depolymerase
MRGLVLAVLLVSLLSESSAWKTENANCSMPEYIGIENFNRPARVVYPDTYGVIHRQDQRFPLVMVLHGYGSFGNYHDFFLGVSDRGSTLPQFITLIPNGTVNSQGKHFWNGINCCDWDHSGVDDVAYLNGIVHEAITKLRVDPKKVYIIGHSNGASMTQILACNSSELYAGVVSISPGESPEPCKPKHPMNVLLVHGTQDEVIPYNFSLHLTDKWTKMNGCPENSPSTDTHRDFDCVPTVPPQWDSIFDPYRDHNCAIQGAETHVRDWNSCENGAKVSQWALEGSHHNPAFNFEFSSQMLSRVLRDFSYVEPETGEQEKDEE